jgi:hypothetical protein
LLALGVFNRINRFESGWAGWMFCAASPDGEG